MKFKFGYKDVNKNNAQGIGEPEFRTTSQKYKWKESREEWKNHQLFCQGQI